MKQKIAIVDDDEMLLDAYSYSLENLGFEVETFSDSSAFLKELDDSTFVGSIDLVILDLMMNEVSGEEILKEIRKNPETTNLKVIILSAKSNSQYKAMLLECGADDYVDKSASFDELAARVKKCLKTIDSSLPISDDIIVKSNSLNYHDKTIKLTLEEIRLFKLLSRYNGHPVSREEIEDELYGAPQDFSSNAVNALISRLRNKLGDLNPEFRKTIMSNRGIGWSLVLDIKSNNYD
jgi:DNA-binding response OmpR family regulator